MTGNSRRDSTATRLLVRMLAQRRLEMQQKGQEFAAGEKVQVIGLKGAPQHNGKRGEVLSFDRGKGRYLVRLDSKATQAQTPKPLGIKPPNLLRVCEPRDTGPLWSGATFSDVQKLRAHLEDLPPERVASLRTVAQGIARVPGLRDDALGEGDIMQLLGVVQWCAQSPFTLLLFIAILSSFSFSRQKYVSDGQMSEKNKQKNKRTNRNKGKTDRSTQQSNGRLLR